MPLRSAHFPLLLPVVAAGAATASSPPNILLLMTDQHRFDALGAAGNAGIRTPNLDALAADGLRFTNAYSSTPTCTPARAALLTGNAPWFHGMLGYGIVAPEYPYEMPRTLAAAGYVTAAVGKNHFIVANNTVPAHGYTYTRLYDGLGTGFPGVPEYDDYDAWWQRMFPGKDPLASGGLDWNSWRGAPYEYDEAVHPTAWVGGTAAGFIANQTAAGAGAGAPPFFLKASFHRPHSPYDPPPRVLNATSASDLPPIHAGGNWDGYFASGVGCGPGDADAWCGLMPEPNLTVARRAYYASIAFVDEWIGQVVGSLKANGLYEDTWILFVSDHGDGQGDHYHWRKGYPYEFSSHVPMMIRWPSSFPSKVPRNSTTDLVAELRDVFPTVLSIAGITPPAGTVLDGLPWTCVLLDPTGATCETPYERRQLPGNDVAEAAAAAAGTPTPETTAVVAAPTPAEFRRVTSGGWRAWVDGEHDICYNNTNHWSMLVDGKFKYVFEAFTGTEQLFNLTADPYEMTDVSAVPSYAPTLALWRGRMVAQFEAENRGPAFVQGGELMKRVDSYLYSPYYPKGFLALAREAESRPEFRQMRW